ncbi:uncharacterized protein LOC115317472 [Ixodes scapularis]|uniref:uncharacterized protein LOC115317472 n=1 Tax=Ixodes scapularis TaxID=6945 RepID=UPI001AD6A744|nr:uncharacterized protein LOC115317472 [Ixodes scapularis]
MTLGWMFANRTDISDDVDKWVYSKVWTPPPNYAFDVSVPKGGKKGKFQSHWLQRYKWLAYSGVQKDAFCKTCVLFHAKTGAGKGSHRECKSLVTLPFTRWKDAMESFENHSETDYHKRATVDAQSFLGVMTANVDSIQMQLNKQAKEEHDSNKAKLRAIVETVLLCGRQDLALGGDNDSGRLTLEESVKNDGNFRALLRYRANVRDCILAEHIRTAGNNAVYTSPTIQNEVISIIGNLIQDKIVPAATRGTIIRKE